MEELNEVGLGEAERPNVIVYGGYDLHGDPLVVFVDRYEQIAFHSEPGSARFRELFPGW